MNFTSLFNYIIRKMTFEPLTQKVRETITSLSLSVALKNYHELDVVPNFWLSDADAGSF